MILDVLMTFIALNATRYDASLSQCITKSQFLIMALYFSVYRIGNGFSQK
jgi:hypothetical protein